MLLTLTIIIVLIIVVYFQYKHVFRRYFNDLKMIKFYSNTSRWENYVDANKMTLLQRIPLKICFITLETRDKEFIDLHNKNILRYVESQTNPKLNRVYVYKRYKSCTLEGHKHNVYWCKFHLLENVLRSGEYDYVIWLDSDTIFTDFTVDLGDILSCYSSDIILPLDGKTKYRTLNAGVAVIKNSKLGREIIETITAQSKTSEFESSCINEKNDLNGIWALSCYEQGVMNSIVWNHYKQYLTVFPSSIVHCGTTCVPNSSLILHMYNETNEKRVHCFKNFIN